MDRESPVKLDLVVPVYNEEDVLPLFLRRLDEVFTPETLRSHGIERIRFRLVDDGSRDRSAQIVGSRTVSDERFVLYRLSRNFGHPNALTAGLDHADGGVVAILDADLQDPPELVLEMLERWREGFDVVYAQRRNRKENALKRASYWAFYRLVSFLSELEVPLDSGDFCLIDRRVVDAMHALPERLRFPRILRAWVGFRQTGVVYDRPERQAGRTKYSFSRLYRLATDGIASSSIRLLRVAQLFSFSFAALTIVLLFALVGMLRSYAEDRMLVLFLVGYILVAAGNFVVMAYLYILGAYVGRTYLEAKGRPPYLILEVVGDDQPPQAAR
jgi:dolichol-phosphate mannosyltransferase